MLNHRRAVSRSSGRLGIQVLAPRGTVHAQVQDFMMQGGQGWGREVLALPECAAELSSAGLLVWWDPSPILMTACSRHVLWCMRF